MQLLRETIGEINPHLGRKNGSKYLPLGQDYRRCGLEVVSTAWKCRKKQAVKSILHNQLALSREF